MLELTAAAVPEMRAGGLNAIGRGRHDFAHYTPGESARHLGDLHLRLIAGASPHGEDGHPLVSPHRLAADSERVQANWYHVSGS